MNKNDFKTYLLAASYLAVKLGQEFVKERLPFEFLFDVELDSSVDKSSPDDFIIHLEDAGLILSSQSIEDVVTLLCRENRVPVWIDINVKSCTKTITTLRLICSNRFTNKNEKMYYSERGLGPFGIKSPYFPAGWIEGKKFRLN